MEGRVLAGRYRLIAELGQGGMGSVWRAEHLALHITVAIKLMNPQIAATPGALARFQREALSAAELRSAHIVRVTDYGIDDATPFIVMELLEGETLAERLNRTRTLSAEETKHLLLQVCRALTVAHTKGVVHRDLKPDNIFITHEGDEEIAKVLDFGVAKKADALAIGGDLVTHSGMLLGTPYYMSPEQANGKSSIDGRTDIWSLGVIAYECLTGRRPFVKESLGALLMSICQEEPPRPSQLAQVPTGFDEWFARATARDPDARFSSAAEAGAAMNEVGRAAPPSTPSVPRDVVTSVVGQSHATDVHLTPKASISLDALGANVSMPTYVVRLPEAPESVIASTVTAIDAADKHAMRRASLLALPALLLVVAAGIWGASRLRDGTKNTRPDASMANPTLAVAVPIPSMTPVTASPLPAASVGSPEGVTVSPVAASQPVTALDARVVKRGETPLAPPTATSHVSKPENKRQVHVINHAGF